MSPVPVVTHPTSSDERMINLGSLIVDSRSDSERPMDLTATSQPIPCSPSQTEHQHQRDNKTGLFGKCLGCFKPMFTVVNQLRRSLKERSNASDGWEIPVDRISMDSLSIGAGIEGTVFLGKFNGRDIACKRVKSKEETNIKHLKNLNHINVIQFRGIAIASPIYYVVMEYCAYGSLYDVLKRRRVKSSWTKVTQVLDWSRQVANGVDYLHSKQIVHGDLKSPNILFFDKHTLKISDFGTSKLCVDRRGQLMPISGTAAWLAPEVIRNELCSEKIDVWSFGIVVWEILTCAVPYNGIDTSAVLWGVGKGNLTLPIPLCVPESLKSLMNLCWTQRSLDRPSFEQILQHLNSNERDISLFEQEQEYVELTRICSSEITEHLVAFPTIDLCSTVSMTDNQLLQARQEELRAIANLRSDYQTKTQQVNTMYSQVSSLMTELEKRECLIKEKEQMISNTNKKRTMNSTNRETRRTSLSSDSNDSRQRQHTRRKTSSSSRKESSTEDLSTGLSSHRIEAVILPEPKQDSSSLPLPSVSAEVDQN